MIHKLSCNYQMRHKLTEEQTNRITDEQSKCVGRCSGAECEQKILHLLVGSSVPLFHTWAIGDSCDQESFLYIVSLDEIDKRVIEPE